MSKQRKIKIVPGKGENINISEIKEHLDLEKPQDDVDKDKIIIPTKKNKK